MNYKLIYKTFFEDKEDYFENLNAIVIDKFSDNLIFDDLINKLEKTKEILEQFDLHNLGITSSDLSFLDLFLKELEIL